MPRFILTDDVEEEEEENEPPFVSNGTAATMSSSFTPESPRGGESLGSTASSASFFYGQTRYALYHDVQEAPEIIEVGSEPLREATQKALVSTYVNTETTPMKTLLKYAARDYSRSRANNGGYDRSQERKSGYGGLEEAWRKVSRPMESSTNHPFSYSLHQQSAPQQSSSVPPPLRLELPAEYAQISDTEARIRVEMDQLRRRFEKKHLNARRQIQALLDECRKETQERERQQQLQAKLEREKLEREQEKKRKEEEARRQAEEAAQKERERQEELRQEQLRRKKEKELELKRQAEKAAAEKAAAAAAKPLTDTEKHFLQVDKLLHQLPAYKASAAPFDKSKAVAKRRLAMKKIVNGKVNTLSGEVAKVKSVASDVSEAIAAARTEDGQIQEALKAGNAEYTPEMAKGKRYFVDLLCTKVMVRVQAEGFNGQRGDGFPLAHMLSIVAAEQKEITPVLQAHVYSVCPTAIPRLPAASEKVSEEELMESLGMQKGKTGEVENFQRFLARTEGIVSIVANIMASEPSLHNLFDGHKGAVDWLSRFLAQLPPPPLSPLPLITAPVLDAFLTGAGHMLANKYPDKFKKELVRITKDVVPRLDEGSLGKPSATRLRKTLEGGFKGFKTKLPNRALAELYFNLAETTVPETAVSEDDNSPTISGPTPAATASNLKASTTPFTPSAQSTPFTPSAQSTPFTPSAQSTPFTPSAQSTPFTPSAQSAPFTPSAQSTPFAPSAQPNAGLSSKANPFAPASMQTSNIATQPQYNSMDSTNMDDAPSAPAAFGGFGAPQPGMTQASPFGMPAAAPFGNAAVPGPSPFGASQPPPFGAPAPSPFGGPVSSSPFVPAPAPSPFGASVMGGAGAAPFVPQQNSPFGAPTTPFGGNYNAPAPSSFGNPSPFGGQTTSFGNQAAPPFGQSSSQATPFAPKAASQNTDMRPPCKFFAQGHCRYGNNCKFSHNTAGSAPSFSNPFGAGR